MPFPVSCECTLHSASGILSGLKMELSQSIESYCSWCFKKTHHYLLEKNYLRRNIYCCDSCEQLTLECRLCEHMAKAGYQWDDELCAEHDGTINSFKRLDIKLSDITDFKEIFKRDSVDVKKAIQIGAFTIGGIATLGPLSVVTPSGLLAGSSLLALGGSSSATIIAASGTALGGTLGGVISNAYFQEVQGFDIKLIKEGSHPRVLFIDGFLTQKDEEPTEWKTVLKELYPDNAWYQITWESQCLHDLGKYFGGMAAKELTQELVKAAMSASAKKAGPVGAALSVFGLASNPWHIAMFKAAQTGILLSDIIARTDADYILCGHSLGARVIYYALEELNKLTHPQIDTIHLLGGAVGNKAKDWEALSHAVKNKIHNYHSENDLILASLYKAGTAMCSNPIGYHPIDTQHAKICNHDVSEYVKGHTFYKEQFHLFAKV